MPSQDFAHEAWNSDKVREDFAHLKGKTALYVPEVLWAERRCLVMECESTFPDQQSRLTVPPAPRPAVIEGARVDDLKYLKEHQIDRNQVSQELSKIFSQMVYINGCESPRRALEHLMLKPLARRLPRRPTPRQPSDPSETGDEYEPLQIRSRPARPRAVL